jgi:hypothetical protein
LIREIHFSLCFTYDIFAPQSTTVRKNILTLFCCLLSSLFTLAQTGVDSSKPLIDTMDLRAKDSLSTPTTILLQFKEVLRNHPYYNFFGKPVDLTIQERKVQGSEKLFYGILLLFFYYAMIRVFFQKYLSNVFALFFRATLRQQQIREQLLQTPLPSLLLNILFVTAVELLRLFDPYRFLAIGTVLYRISLCIVRRKVPGIENPGLDFKNF